MKKWLTPERMLALEDALKNYSGYAATHKKVKTPAQFREDALSSWNSYQKSIKVLNNAKPKKYNPSSAQRQKMQNLIKKFNKRINDEKINMQYLSERDIMQASPTWNSFQRTMKQYRSFLKKNATQVVGTTNAGQPLYKWEQDIVNTNLPLVNARREATRLKMKFSYEAGTMGSEEYWSLQPAQNPLDSNREKYRLDPAIKSLINQSNPEYINARALQYKTNFLKSTLKIQNEVLQSELWKLVQQTDPITLYSIQSGDALMSITFIYDEKALKDIESGETYTWDERGALVYKKLMEGLNEQGFEIR